MARLLGSSSIYEVFDWQHEERFYAVKLVKKPELSEQLLRETRLLKRLEQEKDSHLWMVQCLRSGLTSGYAWLVMPRFESNLGDWCQVDHFISEYLPVLKPVRRWRYFIKCSWHMERFTLTIFWFKAPPKRWL
jgi:hypothetical protein